MLTSQTAHTGWVHTHLRTHTEHVVVKTFFTAISLLLLCFDHRWISGQAVIQTRWRYQDLGWPRLAWRPSSQHTSPSTAQRLVKVKPHYTVAFYHTVSQSIIYHCIIEKARYSPRVLGRELWLQMNANVALSLANKTFIQLQYVNVVFQMVLLAPSGQKIKLKVQILGLHFLLRCILICFSH